MKGKNAMLMYAIAAAMGGNNFIPELEDHEKPEPKPYKNIIPNGCKEYTIDGITVVAISEKSAIKKVQKMKKT